MACQYNQGSIDLMLFTFIFPSSHGFNTSLFSKDTQCEASTKKKRQKEKVDTDLYKWSRKKRLIFIK